MLLVEFSLPLDATGWQWGDHLDVSRPITPGATYDNVGNLAGHPMNIYPFSAVYNSTQGLALGIPLDTPRVFHIRYDHTERDRVGYVISFPLALTQDTKDSPGQGEFEFIIYGFAGQWGFRAAAQKYYDSFPEYYVRRVTEAGNWLFLQDYRGIPAFFFHLGTKAVSFYDGTRITTLPQDRWVRVRFVIDCSSQTCDLYLDDLTTPVVTNVPFREPIENFEKAYLRIGKEQTSGEDYWHTLQIVAVTDY